MKTITLKAGHLPLVLNAIKEIKGDRKKISLSLTIARIKKVIGEAENVWRAEHLVPAIHAFNEARGAHARDSIEGEDFIDFHAQNSHIYNEEISLEITPLTIAELEEGDLTLHEDYLLPLIEVGVIEE